MPATIEAAIAACAAQSAHGPAFGKNECQMRVRLAYRVPSDGTPTAAADWHNSKRKHATANPYAVPRGGVLAWTGGSTGAGHRAIATGDGRCWSTDIRRIGHFDLVPISEIHARWGLTFVGWTEDIDGVTVWHADDHAQDSDTIRAAVGNFQSLPVHSKKLIRADMRKMFTLDPDVTFSCEIKPATYRSALRVVARRHGHPAVYGLAKDTAGDGRTENAITLGHRLSLHAPAHTRRLSDGLAKVTPNRDMTIVRTVTPAGLRVAHVATHLVSGGWSEHTDSTTAWRRATWHAEADRIRAKVQQLHDHGWSVLVGGDLNHPHAVTWHADQITAANQGLMQLAVIPAKGIRAHVGPLSIIPADRLTTDHPIIAAPVTLAK